MRTKRITSRVDHLEKDVLIHFERSPRESLPAGACGLHLFDAAQDGDLPRPAGSRAGTESDV